ncbi:hypothetical protein ACGFOU_19335 [Streptomyces sp. NPDC048595]|uniref:hypothetical protein n=1 Tax=Streptomyces sp. NPDC048595 TaxID=3365576 RepID=UPI0037114FF3
MSVQLRETAQDLAQTLWREHTVYRERSGGVVIRGEHVQRWISLAPAGGRDEILIRAGRILDGGTTAPARSEAVVSLSTGTVQLAATCRRLLAEAASGPTPAASRPATPRHTTNSAARKGRSVRGRGFGYWVMVACVVGIAALSIYSASVTS